MICILFVFQLQYIIISDVWTRDSFPSGHKMAVVLHVECSGEFIGLTQGTCVGSVVDARCTSLRPAADSRHLLHVMPRRQFHMSRVHQDEVNNLVSD